MKLIGIFEAKTRLSEVCEQVAATREPVTVTKRGKPLVRIDPLEDQPMSIRERRDAYMASQGSTEQDDAADFTLPERPGEVSEFDIEDRACR